MSKDIITKVCSTCKRELPLTAEYFGISKRLKDGFRGQCKECRKIEYLKDRERNILRSRKNYRNNVRHAAERNKAYKQNHKEYYKYLDKQYYAEHREEIIQRSKRYLYKHLEQDMAFKILHRCRSRLYKAVKGWTKSASTIELVGCTVEELIAHIENQFQEGMTWNNYGEWHIDHIIPCATFDFSKPEEQFKCFNYTNLQPLWAEDNYRKHDKIIAS